LIFLESVILLKKLKVIPLTLSDLDRDPGEVWVDRKGTILRFDFFRISNTLEKVESYSSLDLQTIERNMKNGEVTYIKASSVIPMNPEATQLDSISFSSATLEYRQNTQNGYILPYVHFSGMGKDKNGDEYAVEAISPAVKVQ
jgi:hypothetical protein